AIKQDMREDQKAAERVALADEAVEVETREQPAPVVVNSQQPSQADEAPISVQEAFAKTGTPPRTEVLEPGYYVVVGAFSVKSYAYRFARQIKTKGYTATTALNPQKDLYYVYIFSSYNLDEARKVRDEYRAQNLFSDSWIFMMPGE